MKLLSALLLSSLLTGYLPAQQLNKPAGNQIEADPNQEKADIVEQILTLREPAEFAKALAKAKQAKLPEQTLFEAQFLYAIDKGNYPALTALKDRADLLTETFAAKNSEIFAAKEDWLAVVKFIHALDALENDNAEGFKEAIKEAYWLSPDQAPAFSPHIEQFKVNKLIAQYTLPATQSFSLTNSNKTISFEQLIKNPKTQGIVIYVYSPWSREAAASTPEIKKFHALCKKAGYLHLQHNIEDPAESKEDVAEYQTEAGKANCDYWTSENEASPLIESLRIKRTPLAVVIDRDGKIKFHGSALKLLTNNILKQP